MLQKAIDWMYDIHMKPVTINVSEPVYALFQAEAKKRDRTAAELIREAMELYVNEKIHPARDIMQWHPLTLGGIKKDWADGSFREEMLDAGYDR
jgi:hypothetical protein